MHIMCYKLFEAGGAVIAVPAAIVLACCGALGGKEQDKNNTIGQFALSAGIAALSGVVGYAMIYAPNDSSEMSASQFAAATAVGSAVFNGGIAVLGAMCSR